MLQWIKLQIKIYGTWIKRGLLLVNIFLMLMATQILVNYTTIIENTETIRVQATKVEEEMAYIKNYQIKFLNSDHAKFFLAHENNILGWWETVVAFKEKKPESEMGNQNSQQKITPREEWKMFFAERL